MFGKTILETYNSRHRKSRVRVTTRWQKSTDFPLVSMINTKSWQQNWAVYFKDFEARNEIAQMCFCLVLFGGKYSLLSVSPALRS